MLLNVGHLLLGKHVLLEGRDAIVVGVDGEGERAHLLLKSTQRGVDGVDLGTHRAKLIESFKLLGNHVQLLISFFGHVLLYMYLGTAQLEPA